MKSAITILGLGPGDAGQLTLAAVRALQSASRVILRTDRHGAARWLEDENISYTTLDAFYESAEDFEDLSSRAAAYLAGLAAEGPLLYAVPGDGVTGDGTVDALLALDVDVVFIPGVSAETAALAACGAAARQASNGFVRVPAAMVAEAHFDEKMPLLVTQLDDPVQAGEVKLALSSRYGDETQVIYISGGKARTIPLYEMDRQSDIDHNSCAYLPGIRSGAGRYTWNDLITIMDVLRGPGGCPWDREQTHDSLRRYLLEECYETLDAIDRDDMDDLCGELGDVLMQVVFHSRVAAERGDFDARDVTDHICRKMLRRHPHVFADGDADTPDAVSVTWDAIKRQEKGIETHSQTLAEVPQSFTALMRAEKIQARAAKAGFDWPDVSGPFDKITEEMQELRQEVEQEKPDPERIGDEMGDLLFAAVNTARHLGVSPELALMNACHKFTGRFAFIEKRAAQSGREMTELTLDDMEEYWVESKKCIILQKNKE